MKLQNNLQPFMADWTLPVPPVYIGWIINLSCLSLQQGWGPWAVNLVNIPPRGKISTVSPWNSTLRILCTLSATLLLILLVAKALYRRFLWPPPGVWSSAKMAHKTPGNTSLTTVDLLQRIFQKIRMNIQMEEMWRAMCVGRGTELPCPLQAQCFSPETLGNPGLWGFMEVSLHKHAWLNHWPLVIKSTSSPWKLEPKVLTF